MSVLTTPADILLVHSDPQIMSGVPVFIGTRVPARTLFDYLIDGCDLSEFLDNFPTVKKEQAVGLLEFASKQIMQEGLEKVDSGEYIEL